MADGWDDSMQMEERYTQILMVEGERVAGYFEFY